jgi:hypothetical protein
VGKSMDTSENPFIEHGSFSEIFPTLAEAEITFAEFEGALKKGEGRLDIRENGALQRCGNPKCFRGGYKLSNLLHFMVAEAASEREVDLRCPGDEGTAKRPGRRKCMRSIRGKIKAEYRDRNQKVSKP